MLSPALPKDVLADPRHEALLGLLTNAARPLWEDGEATAPTLTPTTALFAVLRRALWSELASQGLERASEILAGEQKGLDAVRRKTPQAEPPRPRISRVLFVTNDGSTRFYRDCDGLLRRYADRLLVCRLEVTGDAFGEAILGKPKLVRSVLVADKRVCAEALLALLPVESGSSRDG